MKARKGMTLVELVVAMTILSFVLLAMSGMFVIVSRRGANNEADLRRAAYVQQSVSLIEATPYANLVVGTTTDSTKLAAAWYKRVIEVKDSVETVGGTTRKVGRVVRVTITPRGAGRPETMQIIRAKPTCTSVLNTAAGAC